MYLSNIYRDRILARRYHVRECFLATCIGLMTGGCNSSVMAENVTGAQPSPVIFNISAQPLASALDDYSATTGLQVVYDGALAMGRVSKPVVGSMSPDAALRELLEGTGLTAVYAAHIFTIMPAPAMQSRVADRLDGFMPYLAAIQGRVEQAFCGSPLTRPGGYRIKFRFWISPGGEVLRPQLLGSTDNGTRDEAIMRALGSLTIDRPPPPDMPQPVVMAISSRLPTDTGDCTLAAPAIPGRSTP